MTGTDILLAFGLVLVIEGGAYALFPSQMKQMMAILQQQTAKELSTIGLVVATIGGLIVWAA